MIILAIVLATALFISVASNLYLHNQSVIMEEAVRRFKNNATSEIEYIESELDRYKEIVGKTNYYKCAVELERTAKSRGSDVMVLVGQAEGLLEAASFLRREAKHVGIKV
jgi:hypothetical protein